VNREKNIIFVAFAALCAAMLILFLYLINPAEAADQPAGNTSQAAVNTPNFYATQDNTGSRELFYRMMVSVILIVILGGAAMYVSKKFLPKIVSQSGKNIHILETTHLGPRKMVHLLNIGERKLLIGSTSDNITMLADVTDALTNKTTES